MRKQGIEKEKDFVFDNGFMINTKQFISEVDYKMKYVINVIDMESVYNREYVKTNLLPFWESLEQFTFENIKEANEQFLRSYDYYKNYER